MNSAPDRSLEDATRSGFNRVTDALRGSGSTLGPRMDAWVRGLVPAGDPWTYMLHPRSFPALRLPWLLETAAAGRADPDFQEDLIASSIAGYLYIRLMDQVMDERDAPERVLLPALNVLHLAFLEPYLRRFPVPHPFQDTLKRLWCLSADLTLRDEVHVDPDEAEYRFTTGRKNCAARIPLEAVLHRHGRDDLRGPWTRFFEAFGAWHQMEDDVLDWVVDTNLGHETFFLAEARRRAAPDGTPGTWILGDGLPWAFDLLARWWADVRDAAGPLGSPGLETYLDQRAAVHARLRTEVQGSLALMRSLFHGGAT